MTLENKYNYLCNTPSDINEHLESLKQYALKCKHITEMGVRWPTSTIAFLLSNPKKLISIDLFHPTHYAKYYGDLERLELINNYISKNNINFEFILGNTLQIDIEETDMLFIDTLHVYGQLKAELERHHKKVKKYLIFHDTTTFADIDENPYYNVSELDKSKTGLWPAIEEFLQQNDNWKLIERKTNNNGLTILGKN